MLSKKGHEKRGRLIKYKEHYQMTNYFTLRTIMSTADVAKSNFFLHAIEKLEIESVVSSQISVKKLKFLLENLLFLFFTSLKTREEKRL